MGVNSDSPTSRRGYLSQDELAQLADITITDSVEADDRISQAEELIDAYVGYVSKFMDHKVEGLASASGASSITLQTDQQNIYEKDYFKLCEIELIGGTPLGNRRKITGSTKAGVITVDSAFDTTPSSAYYRIYQLGKFPRKEDATLDSTNTPNTYYKAVPEAVKRAVAAQVQYMIEMGDSYFAGDEVDKTSESIGDYSYTKSGSGGFAKLIAPKAKLLLRGYVSRTGNIIV